MLRLTLRRGRGTTTAAVTLMVALATTVSACAAPTDARADIGRPTMDSAARITSSPSMPPPSVVTRPIRHIIALGDSVTAGTACGCTPFVTQLASMVGGKNPVVADNAGTAGLTAHTLLAELDTDADLDDRVRAADLVVVTIGANDLEPARQSWLAGGCRTTCWTSAVTQVQQDLAAILVRLTTLTSAQHARVLVTDYWDVFEDGQVATERFGASYVQFTHAITTDANTAICGAVAGSTSDPRPSCVDLYAPFTAGTDHDPTPLLADDADHPNAAGHRLIATVLDQALTSG